MHPYEKVAAAIRKDITTGRLAVGQRLPSTRKLAGDFKVSLTTVNRAIALLQDQGLVETKPKSGTLVIDTEPRSSGVEPPLRAQVADLRERLLALEDQFAATQSRLAALEQPETPR